MARVRGNRIIADDFEDVCESLRRTQHQNERIIALLEKLVALVECQEEEARRG